MINVSLRRRARQFTKLVRRSVLTPRTGHPSKPVLTGNGQLGLTFIGHSSFFVQISGLNLVIDPNFARWLFVLKRLRRPGVKIPDLPGLDLVLVTHAHFDHLHRPSLRALVRHTRRLRKPAPAIVVPRHVADLVSDLGFREIIELDWWEEFSHGGISVVHTPSRHWGARVVRDMHRGFGGYVIRSRRESLYHAGDTAYFPGFREIGERLRPDVAMLPIGAYEPPSFRNVHTSPADAVRAFLDLRARYLVPMHYGSFRLSHEPMDEPLKFLSSEAKKHGIEDQMLILQEGVTQVFE